MIKMLWNIGGTDPRLYSYCSKRTQWTYGAFGSMLLLLMVLVIHSFFQTLLIGFDSSILSLGLAVVIGIFFLNSYRLCLMMYGVDLANFNIKDRIEIAHHQVTEVFLFLACIVFSIPITNGILLWIFETQILTIFSEVIEGGDKLNHLKSLIHYQEGDSVSAIDSLLNRITTLYVICLKSHHSYYFTFFIVAGLFLIPWICKMYIAEIYRSDYQVVMHRIQRSIVLSEYAYANDLSNMIRYEEYDLPAIVYEHAWDPPFNTQKRYPPLDKSYSLDEFYKKVQLHINEE